MDEMPLEKPLPDNLDVMPWADPTPSKRSFIPSRTEIQQINKIARAIKKGWIKLDKRPEKPKYPSPLFTLTKDITMYGPERVLRPHGTSHHQKQLRQPITSLITRLQNS